MRFPSVIEEIRASHKAWPWRGYHTALFVAEDGLRKKMAGFPPPYLTAEERAELSAGDRFDLRVWVALWVDAVSVVPRLDRITRRQNYAITAFGASKAANGHADCGCLHTYRYAGTLRNLNDWPEIRAGLRAFGDSGIQQLTDKTRHRAVLLVREHLATADQFTAVITPYGGKIRMAL